MLRGHRSDGRMVQRHSSSQGTEGDHADVVLLTEFNRLVIHGAEGEVRLVHRDWHLDMRKQLCEI